MGLKRIAQHGTRSKYVLGCHCPLCTRANRDYQRSYMSKWAARKPKEPPKQCLATAMSGTRCKRLVPRGSEYCFKHPVPA